MFKRLITILSVILLFFVNSFCLAAEKLEFQGFVSDNAHVLSDNAISQINGFLFDLQQKTGTDIAVVTLKTLSGRPIEETALNIGRDYKLGKKGENNGAVVLVVPPEKVMRIEIGYGLEGVMNDAKVGRIRDDYMLPYFRQGDYQSGIIKGTYMLADDVAKSYGVSLSPVDFPSATDTIDISEIIFLMLILFLLFGGGFFPFIGGGRGGFGGFGGFDGGGGFGGGGASGRW